MLYVLGCDKGERDACSRASKLVGAGAQGVPKDAGRSLDFATKACQRSTGWQGRDDCDRVAASMEKTDKPKAVAMWQDRCEKRRDAHACAKWKAAGGAPEDEVLAVVKELAERRCKAGDGDACRSWKEVGGAPTPEQLKLPAKDDALVGMRPPSGAAAAGTTAPGRRGL